MTSQKHTANTKLPSPPEVRADIARMEAYTPVKPFDVLSKELGREPAHIVKLDANENPYGPSPAVIEALRHFPWYHIYPDPQQQELRKALSTYVGVPVDYILPGHGADELLDYLCRLYLMPGDLVVDCPPTFGMYAFDAALSGGQVLSVQRREDFSLDLDGIERAVNRADTPPRLLFVTSPNNPDGGLVSHSDLQRLLRLPVLVVVDEAYIEFADGEGSIASWVPQRSNLVVLRTFSKWAGLAGLRLGYGVFPLPLMQHLWKFKQPYNVNVAATVAGLASLSDLPTLNARVNAIKLERDRMFQELRGCSWLEPVPSQANFILAKVIDRPASDLHRHLIDRGILVRYYDKPGLRNFIRISVGRPEDTERLLQGLRSL